MINLEGFQMNDIKDELLERLEHFGQMDHNTKMEINPIEARLILLIEKEKNMYKEHSKHFKVYIG